MALMKCVCIDPGKLKHLVDVVMPVKDRASTSGHEREAPKLVARVRAAIEPAATQDIWQAAQVQTKVTHRITIRYRPGVTGEMWIMFRGRKFSIVGEPMNPEEQNIFLVMMCCEGH